MEAVNQRLDIGEGILKLDHLISEKRAQTLYPRAILKLAVLWQFKYNLSAYSIGPNIIQEFSKTLSEIHKDTILNWPLSLDQLQSYSRKI